MHPILHREQYKLNQIGLSIFQVVRGTVTQVIFENLHQTQVTFEHFLLILNKRYYKTKSRKCDKDLESYPEERTSYTREVNIYNNISSQQARVIDLDLGVQNYPTVRVSHSSILPALSILELEKYVRHLNCLGSKVTENN